MKRSVSLSTIIDADVKQAASAYCKRHGIKLQYLIEKALVEHLEDAIDLEAYHQRKDEPTILLNSLRNKKSKKT